MYFKNIRCHGLFEPQHAHAFPLLLLSHFKYVAKKKVWVGSEGGSGWPSEGVREQVEEELTLKGLL